MTQDNNDDPFAPRDETLYRPRPGAGRRPGAAPAAPGAPPPYQPAPPTPRGGAVPAGARAASIGEFMTTGLNPLVQAATPLLVLVGRLRGQISQADVDALRRQTTQEIRAFEDRARAAGVSPEDVLAARYGLCTVLDEAVMNTPWGAQSGWSSQSLLVTFHREASGGVKFFQLLERVSADPRRYIALLELFYICLSLGFEGKYRVDERGASKLAELRSDLYRNIRSVRSAPLGALSAHWRGVEDRRNAVLRFVPLWVVAAACVAALVGTYAYFSKSLSARAEPIDATLARIGLDPAYLAPPAPSAGPARSSGLREALAGPIGDHLVELNEAADRADIILVAPDLFGSGSGRINARYLPLLKELGTTLERFPGRVIVVGHTDSRPIRSLEYRDNYDLSRDRAQRVADAIKANLTNPARVDAVGLGASKPRYTPPDDPANQARNRRVEILFRREG
ncbi:MAG TPA: type IVB secretion system protein IcmH/DotU [Steroidobacteraceae bacterium]|nr:type IVB secretion system protein IcmH/DotU [Steroidobacteraceae bacterium]